MTLKARAYFTLGRWTEADRPWFRVIVHETTAELRRAAAKARPHVDWSDTDGCFHPAPHRYRINDDDTETLVGSRRVGTIRLSRQRLDMETVAHEATHLAAATYRRHYKSAVDLGDDCEDDEEMFAYILGDAVNCLCDALRVLDLWPVEIADHA